MSFEANEARVRELAMSMPPSDFGSPRAIRAVAELIQKDADAARQFVLFVLRHTFPERAEHRTAAETYSIIANHPYAKQHGIQKAEG